MRLFASSFGTMLLASLLLGAPFQAAAAENSPSVILSEVNWAGSALSTADEWIELANVTATPVDLSGWSLMGATGSAGTAIAFPSGTVVDGYGTYLISNYDLASGKTTLNIAPQLVTTAVSLPNSKLNVALLDASGNVVETATTDSVPKTGSTSPFASMERDLSSLNWVTATVNGGLTDSAQLGSPGTFSLSAPVEALTPTPVQEEVGLATALQNSSSGGSSEETSLPTNDPSVQPPTTPPSTEASPSVTVETPSEPPSQTPLEEQPPTPEPTQIPSNTLPTESTPVEQAGSADDAALVPADVDAAVENTASGTGLVAATEAAAEETEAAEPATNAEATAVSATATDSSQTETGFSSVDTAGSNREEDGQAIYTLDLPEEHLTSPSPTVGDVLITEFISDPSDGAEWVEIYNATNASIDLTGWTITDATDKATELSGTLEASTYATIENPKGKLNNSGDSIFLYDPTGEQIDTVVYGTDTLAAPKKGESAARAGQKWFMTTTPTPGAINFVSDTTIYDDPSPSSNGSASPAQPTSVVDSTDSTNTLSSSHDAQTINTGSSGGLAHPANTSTTTTSVKNTTGSKSRSPEKSTKTTTKSSSTKALSAKKSNANERQYSGIMTALPGTFGSQIAFIDGIEIYFHDADWPALSLGDLVTVQGVTSTAQGESRIKLAGASAITVIGHQEERPATLPIDQFADAKEGSLVQVEGTIASREGKTLVLENEEGSIEVIAHEKTDIRWSAYTGGTLRITGVVRHLNGEVFLYPRTSSDIATVSDPLAASTATENISSTESSSGGKAIPFAAGAVGTTGISGAVLWFLRRRRSLIPALG